MLSKSFTSLGKGQNEFPDYTHTHELQTPVLPLHIHPRSKSTHFLFINESSGTHFIRGTHFILNMVKTRSNNTKKDQ